MGIGSNLLSIVLGGIFLVSGVAKLSGITPIVQQWNVWRLPQWFRSVTGIVEIIGGVGLLLGILAGWLSSLAGLWLAATMVGALLTHLRIHDPAQKMAPSATLLVLSVLVSILGWPALAQHLF
jgi:uncharacterized membrane protein YphA (DoxX/SURF4 family)